MINGRNFFDQPIKIDLKHIITLKRLQQVEVMITLQYVYQIISISKKYYKLIAVNLSKQQKLDADPKAIQQVNFNGNLNRAEGPAMLFIIEEAKEIILDFSKGTVKVL